MTDDDADLATLALPDGRTAVLGADERWRSDDAALAEHLTQHFDPRRARGFDATLPPEAFARRAARELGSTVTG